MELLPQQERSIERLRRVGESRGLALVTDEAFANKGFLYYQCKRNHKIKVRRSSTYSRHWAGQCETCVYEARLEELERIAKNHGGRIASEQTEFKTRDWVTIECGDGHQTKKRVYSVLEGTWCSVCFFDSIRSSIEDAEEYAIESGGTCLSTSCSGGSDPLLWECENGHRWRSSLNEERSLRRFCPICKISKGSKDKTNQITRSTDAMLERAQKMALSHGGRCLSKTFRTTREKLQWECSDGHRWWAPAQSVLYNGAWCNTCSLKKRPGAITKETLQHYAESHGGVLLSEEYRRNDIKLLWRCENGHEFQRAWMVARKTKYFCPVCRKQMV